jgi:hypothetical protein
VEAVATLHLDAHGGDVENSLAAVPADRQARAGLGTLKEPRLEATLASVGRARAENGEASEPAGLPSLRNEPDLMAIRPRPAFQLLLLDLSFPEQSFAP